MSQITLEQALDIIQRAKNCLVCAAISEPIEVIASTLDILDECPEQQITKG